MLAFKLGSVLSSPLSSSSSSVSDSCEELDDVLFASKNTKDDKLNRRHCLNDKNKYENTQKLCIS